MRDHDTRDWRIKTLDQLVDAAKSVRTEFLDHAQELRRYAYDYDYDFEYQKHAPEASFKAKVAKAAQYLDVMGAYLWQDAPEPNFEAAEDASIDVQRRVEVEQADVRRDLLATDFRAEGARWVESMLLTGRGVVFPTWNQRRKAVEWINVEVDDFLVDADAASASTASWMGREITLPRWQLRQLVMGIYQAQLQQLAPPNPIEGGEDPGQAVIQEMTWALEMVDRAPVTKKRNRKQAKGSKSKSGELVTYVDFYSFQPLEVYCDRDVPEDAGATRFLFIPKIGVLIQENGWQVPFDQTGEMPFVLLDYTCGKDRLWPISPLQPGLGYMRALNWIYTLYISRMQYLSNKTVLFANYNGQGIPSPDQAKIFQPLPLEGSDMQAIEVRMDGEMMPLRDMLMEVQLSSGVDEFERFVAIIAEDFEKVTGLYEILFAGQTATQSRSATDAQLRQTNSMSRVTAMDARIKAQVIELVRRQAFMARALKSPEDIAQTLGPKAASFWGILNPEGAQQEAQIRSQMFQVAEQAGIPINTLLDQIGPARWVSLDSWLYEAERTVDVSSLNRLMPGEKRDGIIRGLNTIAPLIAPIPGGQGIVLEMVRDFAETFKMGPGVLQQIDKAMEMSAMMSMGMGMGMGLPAQGPAAEDSPNLTPGEQPPPEEADARQV